MAGFAAAMAGQAAAHAATLWADTTYLQPAQPSTFGHYLGGFAEQAVRHLDRLETAYERADTSPGGAGGSGGTRLPVDRARLAARLGFAAVGAHTRDAMWSADALADAVAAAVQAVATAGQLAADLEIFASPAFGYVTLDASLCRASVLMPQKRNPYALPVLRGGAELTVAAVRAAAREVTGTPVPVTAELLRDATDPMTAVLGRDGLGGASPRRVREHARRVRRRVTAARRWNAARRDHIAAAEAALIAAAKVLAAS